MEDSCVAAPWPVLIFGAVILALGGALAFFPTWLEKLFSALGSAAPTPRERRYLPLSLVFVGAGWIFVYWARAQPFANNVRPLWVVWLETIWLPLGGLVLAVAMLWMVIGRRII